MRIHDTYSSFLEIGSQLVTYSKNLYWARQDPSLVVQGSGVLSLLLSLLSFPFAPCVFILARGAHRGPVRGTPFLAPRTGHALCPLRRPSASHAVTASPVRYAPSLPVHVFRDRRLSTPLYESEARNISRIEHRFNAGVWELKFELNH